MGLHFNQKGIRSSRSSKSSCISLMTVLLNIFVHRRSMILMISTMFSPASMRHFECFVSEASLDEMPGQSAELLTAYQLRHISCSDRRIQILCLGYPKRITLILSRMSLSRKAQMVMDFMGIGISRRALIEDDVSDCSQATILKHLQNRNPSSLGDGQRLRPRRANQLRKLSKQARSLRLTQQRRWRGSPASHSAHGLALGTSSPRLRPYRF